MIGTLLANRYRIDAQLGEGGMGVVYRAHDTVLDRPVAVKVLPTEFTAAGAQRLLREARAVAQLDHPHIVSVYDAGEVNGQPFIVMQLVSGKSLREVRPTIEEAISFARQTCLALEHAHGRGIIHRDVKPDNIMITDGGVVKVMDFGLARSEGRSRLTQAGMLVGTVAYMAPEQVVGGELDARSDLYSLGCVLYELVTGRLPFAGDDPIAVISQHLQVPPVSPHWYNAQVQPELEGIILKLMAKDPAERYPSAESMRSALEQLEDAARLIPPGEARTVTPALLLGTVLRTRLVGRDAELRDLKSALELAASGHGQVILVEGEPGVGKTRLLQEAQIYARLRGFTVLLGRCYEQETSVPYLPIIELFQGRFRDIPRDALPDELGDAAPEFVKLIPDVRRAIPAVEPSPPLEPLHERLRLFGSLSEYLTRLSRRAPIAIVLEDLHWSDAASLGLLQHLAREQRSERVAILGSYRDVEVDRKHPLSDALRTMNRERLYARVSLRRLSRDGVAAMVRTMFEIERVSDEFLDLLYGETEGNPFFVEEVLKSLVEDGTIYREDGHWERKEIAEIHIPQSVTEVLGLRLERASESCQAALSLAAVIGRRFRFEILQAVGDLPEEDVLRALEEAIQMQLVHEENAGGEVEYDFAHALIRDVLYERLSLRRRMTLHQRVGETLEQQYAGRTEVVAEDLAHHYARAPHGTGLEKAIHYAVQAGRKSFSLFAHEDAVRYYEGALDLLRETGNKAGETEVRLALAEAFVYLGNTNAALAAYTQALTYYEHAGDTAGIGQVHRLIGRALQRNWQFAQAIPYLEQALSEIDSEARPVEAIETHLYLARALSFSGRLEEGAQHAGAALALAQSRGTPALQAEAHVAVALGAMRRTATWLKSVLEHNNEAIRLTRGAREAAAHYTLGRALNNNAQPLYSFGRFEEAMQSLEEALEIGRRTRDVETVSFTSLHLATVHLSMGGWEDARRLVEDSLKMGLSPLRRTMLQHRLSMIRGEWEAAADQAKEVVEQSVRAQNVQQIFVYNTLLARHSLDLHRTNDARSAAAAAADVTAERSDYDFWLHIMWMLEGLARGGEVARCADRAARIAALAAEAENPQGKGYALYGRGLVAMAEGRPDDATDLLTEALGLVRGDFLRTFIMRSLAQALRMRDTAGDQERAREGYDECLAILTQIGDLRRVEQVRAEMDALH